MQIQLNGKPADIPAALTASALLGRLDLTGKRVAVEINGEILPRSRHAETHFQPHDKVEIVHAIGGG